MRVDDAYKSTLPDLQNGPASLIRGEKAVIQHVGISNFRLPIRYATRDGGTIHLDNREGKGVTFSIFLPLFPREGGAGERILEQLRKGGTNGNGPKANPG